MDVTGGEKDEDEVKVEDKEEDDDEEEDEEKRKMKRLASAGNCRAWSRRCWPRCLRAHRQARRDGAPAADQ